MHLNTNHTVVIQIGIVGYLRGRGRCLRRIPPPPFPSAFQQLLLGIDGYEHPLPHVELFWEFVYEAFSGMNRPFYDPTTEAMMLSHTNLNTRLEQLISTWNAPLICLICIYGTARASFILKIGLKIGVCNSCNVCRALCFIFHKDIYTHTNAH